MPHVVNGIGTWYYGKRRLHRLRGACGECNAIGDLESYDTTLYGVVFFVPLLPLGSKRILESCPSCKRHKVLPLKKWEALKAEQTGAILEKLQADPDSRENALEALSVAASFQDEALFDKMSRALVDHRTDDAEVQAALGRANGYFARHAQAAEAFSRSIAAQDDPRVREQLGLTLLRLGDPDRAAGCFQHVLDEGDRSRLWLIYQLVVSHQARGSHGAALELLDRVQEKFPDTANDKEWKALRKTSEKDRGRNRPAGKSLLLEGKGAGTREGNRAGSLLPKLILPLILLAFASWHTWRSLTLASARPVYLLNGSAKPYTVAVNGQSVTLSPGQVRPTELPEGTVTLEPGKGAEGLEPGEVQFASSFWGRPYDGTVIVINPDRLGILARETTIYAEVPPPNPPDEHFAGKLLHEIPSVNHAFEPFPNSVSTKKGRSVTRTRVGVAEVGSAEDRIGTVSELLNPAERVEYGRRWLALEPDNGIALMWFAATAPRADALATMKAHLADRPIRVDWHRTYQTVAERDGADAAKIRGEYQSLVDETRRDPDALYLLARVSDRAASQALLQEAVKGGRPAPRAHYALGVRHLCEGNFGPAADELAQAKPLTEGEEPYTTVAREALLAAKRYDELLKILEARVPRGAFLREKARICAIRGDKAGADAAATASLALIPAGIDANVRRILTAALEASQATADGNAARYLAAVEQTPGGKSVSAALLRGDLAGAESLATAPDAATRGLILLATPQTDAEKLSAAKSAFLEALAAGDRDEKVLRDLLAKGNDADPVRAVRELTIQPRGKRVYAAVAPLWYPKQQEAFAELSRKLDFFRDDVSLCLSKFAVK